MFLGEMLSNYKQQRRFILAQNRHYACGCIDWLQNCFLFYTYYRTRISDELNVRGHWVYFTMCVSFLITLSLLPRSSAPENDWLTITLWYGESPYARKSVS